jgi:Zn-dependent protease
MLFAGRSLAELIGLVVALVLGITVHEFSHALTADALGDRLPRSQGRVTLNPAAHIDPMGALFFVLAGFGWGRPVMVNPWALRPGRIGGTMVAAAGPIANVVLATATAVVYRALEIAGLLPGGFAEDAMEAIVFYNVVLALFNLLPIPPLDGFNALKGVLPPRQAYFLDRYGQYGIILLFVLVLIGATTPGGGPLALLFRFAGVLTGLLLGF